VRRRSLSRRSTAAYHSSDGVRSMSGEPVVNTGGARWTAKQLAASHDHQAVSTAFLRNVESPDPILTLKLARRCCRPSIGA
jgi:hypothetical protein